MQEPGIKVESVGLTDLQDPDSKRDGDIDDFSSDISDVEAQGLLQQKEPAADNPPVEYSVSTRVKLSYLAWYFILNLSLTLYNKAILGGFHFPWLMTAIHCGTAYIGCSILLLRGSFSLTRLSTRDNLVLAAFSGLFTLNIAISNVSL